MTAPPRPSAGRRRADVQGLRAVAVGLVLVYHAGWGWLPGGYVGVDVFFVVSGFLITGLLVREARGTGRVRLARFYARRARRLLPATALVFVVVAAASRLWLPPTRWDVIAGDLAAAAGYVVNWRLAARSVDYLAQGAASSPVQHFWSLAVEEQFYVVWPLVLAVLLVAVRRRGHGPDVGSGRLAVALAAIAVPSLAWSVLATARRPGPAYLVSTTRLWELALGGVLAVLAHRVARVPATWRRTAGVVGLGMIGLAGLTFSAATPFPGSAALLPTVGTVLVLAAGTAPDGELRLLGARPLQAVGDASYSLYLWHWPAVVVATALWAPPGRSLQPWQGTLAVLASVLPALLAYRYVERPVHQARALASPPRALMVGAACVVVGMGAALSLQVGWQQARASARAATADAPAGAAALAGAAASGDRLTPSVFDAYADVARLDGHACIGSLLQPDARPCTHGPADAPVVVAVAGDSKMHQWLPALQTLADERGWRLETYLMSACAFVGVDVPDDDGRPFASCRAYNDTRLAALSEPGRYDLVLVSQRQTRAWTASGEGGAELMRSALADTWAQVQTGGARVLVVADNAAPPFDVVECVAGRAASRCGFDDTAGEATQLLAATDAGVGVLDLRPWICPAGTCPAVIGDVLVYRQRSHLTGTYVRTLTPMLGAALDDVLGAAP